MDEGGSTNRIYIAIDPSRVAKCNWCGRLESDDWLAGERGIYCSKECSSAGRARDLINGFIIWQISIPIFVMAIRPSTWTWFFLIWLTLAAISFPLLYLGLRGRATHKEYPKGSRIDDARLDLALLRSVTSVVLCPKCNANLELSKIGQDKTYRCEYCGASGIVEILKTSAKTKKTSFVNRE